jgi:hypothetical protein
MPAAPTNFKEFFEITPQLVPTVAADVVAQDVWLDQLNFTNTTASAITVTVEDKQGTPRAALSAFVVPGNDSVVIAFNRRWMPGGIRWSASATNLVGYARYGVLS